MNRKGVLQTAIIVIIGVLVIGISSYFVFFKKTFLKNSDQPNQETYKKTTAPSNLDPTTTEKENIPQVPINTFGESTPPSLISFTEYERGGAFTVPTLIQQGTQVILKWTSDKKLFYWGDIAYVCLIGLDEQKQPIKLKEGGKSCYPDIQVLIASTPLSSGEYRWSSSAYIEKFTSVPKSFKLSVRVLDSRPSEGLSEWAGLISESTSNEFTFTPRR